ncbi:MAG: endonuclease III [bacterium]|nr:endonuclease III [bacterium]
MKIEPALKAPLSSRLQLALQLLEVNQGVKSWSGPVDALDILILTLLSQNTNDNLRDRAFRSLRLRFPRWEDVLAAPAQDVEAAIRNAGLSRQKAERMQALLRWVQSTFGGFDLARLQETSNDEAIELLMGQKGIGIKTAAVTLMVAFGRDLCPVDTHVHRISQRLGWVSASISAEVTYAALKPHLPPGKGYSLHMNLLQFGRTICRARKPICQRCFLWDECVWEGKGLKGESK